MDRLRQRLSVAVQAAATLRELAVRPAPTKIERDAAIQRFVPRGKPIEVPV